ncbi:MAG: hypothetical protein AAF223_16470, partial [Bacteroidota bacterium]
MKVLGIKQFHQKTFKFLKIKCERFSALLGKVPQHFIMVVYGFSGNGKTEFVMQLAKLLSKFGTVIWLSYEQRHGSDLQMATLRNKMEERNGKFLVVDPIENLDADTNLLDDLDAYLERRPSVKYVVIDSLDYTGFGWKEYSYLKEKYAGKKSFIFIAHSTKTGSLKKAISDRIIFDGGMGFFVQHFICHPEKNRYGGFTPYVVFEEKARERNPTFFAKGKTKKTEENQGGKT